jgi:hypothetical protein
MSHIEDIIAKAWDAEEATQMGEPSPWKVGPFGLDPDWASGRHACATAAIRALEAAGFAIVPREPTPEMISTAAPLAAHAPGARDFAIALTAVNLLPPNEHPDIADVLAQMAVDYRAMIGARPK